MSLIQKYIWVIETIYRTRQISLKELSEKWMDTEMSGGSSISRQTFDRWKTGILDIFGIIIDCNLKAGYKYFIYNPEVLREGELNKWLLDSFSTINTLSQSITLKNRILVEEIPSSKDFLKDIIGAMRDNRADLQRLPAASCLHLSYRALLFEDVPETMVYIDP